MRKDGGYALTTYLLDLLGADAVLVNYLTESVVRTLKYGNRATAISWAGQLLAALRDFAGRYDGHSPAALVRANMDISRRLALYIRKLEMEGGKGRG
mgnify:CR=1 FL=1